MPYEFGLFIGFKYAGDSRQRRKQVLVLDREKYNSVGFTPTGEGWAVGPKGRIATFAK